MAIGKEPVAQRIGHEMERSLRPQHPNIAPKDLK